MDYEKNQTDYEKNKNQTDYEKNKNQMNYEKNKNEMNYEKSYNLEIAPGETKSVPEGYAYVDILNRDNDNMAHFTIIKNGITTAYTLHPKYVGTITLNGAGCNIVNDKASTNIAVMFYKH